MAPQFIYGCHFNFKKGGGGEGRMLNNYQEKFCKAFAEGKEIVHNQMKQRNILQASERKSTHGIKYLGLMNTMKHCVFNCMWLSVSRNHKRVNQ